MRISRGNGNWVFMTCTYSEDAATCFQDVIDSNRGKFRSETSDNMDSWKSRGGKSQRGEEKK